MYYNFLESWGRGRKRGKNRIIRHRPKTTQGYTYLVRDVFVGRHFRTCRYLMFGFGCSLRERSVFPSLLALHSNHLLHSCPSLAFPSSAGNTNREGSPWRFAMLNKKNHCQMPAVSREKREENEDVTFGVAIVVIISIGKSLFSICERSRRSHGRLEFAL